MTRSRQLILIVVSLLVMIFLGSWLEALYARVQQQKAQEIYTRPKPEQPIAPQIPEADRYQDDKVFLEYADSLFRPADMMEEYQVVKGSVKFRQGGMWMFCDSAYYYPERNSMDAFGHVKMEQGDTLFVYADKLFYDGFEKKATLTKGPSRSNVELKNRNVTLVTDSLDYDVAAELGWYTTGGTLSDDVNTLTSIYGEFSASQNVAKFKDDVVLVNNEDGYKMFTEELDYNTDTHIATINTLTRIEGANDTIITTQGWYDTETDHAQLTARSTITHSDSTHNVTFLEGDSIIYDKATRTSRAFMFRNPFKTQQPMVITDTARKVQLIGGYGEYNDSTQHAFATEYPLLIEFSRPDSLFLRADTILTFLQAEYVWPDSLDNNWNEATRKRLTAFGSLSEIADSMPLTIQILPDPWQAPGFGVAKQSFEVVNTDSLILEEAGSMEVRDIFNDEPDRDNEHATEIMEADDEFIAPKRVDALGRDSADMVLKDFHVAKAIGRARAYSNDMQAVADTMIFRQYDSLLHMIRKPVVWNENRQILGGRIVVHFNDSAPDWALLPQGGFMAEHVDEDFYNQLSGTVMRAWLEDQKMKKMDVDGNVEVIYLPQESDSTFNKLVTAESSYLTIDFKDGQIDHLRMWPEVTGTVTPVGDVRKAQKYLQNFIWLEPLRPLRSWYGDRLRWVDELGEVPEVLDKWFREPEVVKSAPPKPADMRDMVR